MSEEDKVEERKSLIPFDVKRIPWKLIFSILAIAGLGGGGGALFMTGEQVEETVDDKIAPFAKELVDHEKLDTDRHVKIDATFKEVKESVNQNQTVQHSQVARDEARRITKDIKNREERERTYDRLVGMSMRRLKNKEEPCLNLDCTN